jgi:hypothetical protein
VRARSHACTISRAPPCSCGCVTCGLQVWAALPSDGVLQAPPFGFIARVAQAVVARAAVLLATPVPFTLSGYGATPAGAGVPDGLPAEGGGPEGVFRARYAVLLLARSTLCPPLSLSQPGGTRLKKVRGCSRSGVHDVRGVGAIVAVIVFFWWEDKSVFL